MKRTTWLAMALVGAVVGCDPKLELPEAKPDLGGLTFDFSRLSERRFAAGFDAKANLAKAALAGDTTNRISKVVDLPSTNGGVYCVSFRAKVHHSVAAGAFVQVCPSRRDAKGRPQARSWEGKRVNLVDRRDAWCDYSAELGVKPGNDGVCLAFNAGRGVGEIKFRDVSVVDVTPTEPIVFKQMPEGNLDSRYCVSEGQCGLVEWYWRKTSPTNKYHLAGFTFKVTLPPGIAFVGTSFGATNTYKTVTLADGSTETTFGTRYWPQVTDAFNGHDALRLLVKPTRGCGVCGKGTLAAKYRWKKESFDWVTSPATEFEVVPTVKAAAKPKRYWNGIMCGRAFGFDDAAANHALAQLFTDAGVTWMVGSGSQEMYADWRNLGITRITPSAWQCCNGFGVGQAGKIPQDDRYVAILSKDDGHYDYITKSAVCPVTVYTESDFFKTNTVPFLRSWVKGTDGMWSNWEPWMFTGKGCYCDRCCKAFAKYVGKPYDEIKKNWPDCVRKGGAYFDKVKKFRSLEHAKLVQTIDRYIRPETGGEKSVGFIPGIAWIEMGSWWRPRNYAAEVQAIDYAGGLEWMNPWGPYVAWESNSPYVEQKRKPLVHFFAAKDVREAVDRDYPSTATPAFDGRKLRKPKLMALPQGYQCSHWLSEPEWIAMALDSYFFHGWESTVEYFFPRGYDARWWRTYAASTERAAKYEDFVKDGTRVDASVKATPVGEYAANVKHLSGYLPEYNDLSPLQTIAWRKDGTVIVAAFNFWDHGEAFFNLKVSGLKGRYAIVDEQGVARVKDSERTTWSAEELAGSGVKLVVGAARTRVFELRPAGDGVFGDAKSVLTDAALKALYESRREALGAEAKKDAEAEAQNDEIVYDSMPVI